MWARVSVIFLLTLVLLYSAGLAAVRNLEKGAPLRGQLIEVEDARLHVLEMGMACKGRGPSIVLIHGASVNLGDMAVALGEALAKDHHVVMLDRPGAGYSDKRPKGAHQIKTQARLIHLTLQELGVERPILIGQSLGGAVSLAYALSYQQSLSGLMVLAPVSHEWPGGVAWYNHAARAPIVGAAFRHILMPLYGALAGEQVVAGGFAPNAAPKDYFHRAGAGLLFRPHNFNHNAQDLVSLKPQVIAMQDRYDALNLPMTIMTGDADTTVSPVIHSAALAKQTPHARLVMLPGIGHALHHTAKGEIINEIERLNAEIRKPKMAQPIDQTPPCS